MRIPIVLKYALLLLASVLVTATLLSWFLLDFFQKETERQLIHRGQSTAQLFAHAIAPHLLTEHTDTMERSRIQLTLNRLIQDADVVGVRVLGASGRVVADDRPENVGREKMPGTKLLLVAPAGHQETAAGILFHQPVMFGDAMVGHALITFNGSWIRSATHRVTTQVVLVTGLTSLLVMILGYLLLRRTLSPLESVLGATQRMSRGDFSVRLAKPSRDEIGDLALEFNRMAGRTELLFTYLDKTIAARLSADESLAVPGGSFRPASVLFGDMRDFTRLSLEVAPGELVRILNLYFSFFFEIVHHFDGIVDKTMGDGVMAFFEPLKPTDLGHARQAATSAVAMRICVTLLAELVEDQARRGTPLWLPARDFGFAVATGRLIVGNIGSKRRMDYTVCGPAVNLASRLQTECRNGEVLFDRFTAMDVEEVFLTRALPPVMPKGFTHAQEVTPHQVIGLQPKVIPTIRGCLMQVLSRDYVEEQLLPEAADHARLDTVMAWIENRLASELEVTVSGFPPPHEPFSLH